jgi:hypothetical protein
MKFKPQLLPNNKAGEAIDWEDRIRDPRDWMVSDKYDGARVELFCDGAVKGRSLKGLPSFHINRMAEDFALTAQHTGVIEAEFYAPNMNFSEIMHFFKTEDVTSEKTVAKYRKLWEKTGGSPAKGWKYPGRSVRWLTTWHPELQFYVFDTLFLQGDDRTKLERYHALKRLFTRQVIGEDDAVLIPQYQFSHVDAIYQAYDQSIMNGGEGLVMFHKDSNYKMGRHTLNARQAFKIKEDNLEYDGQVLEVEESTVAREGSDRTTNELGRSVTSKLKEDRLPSGMAKGFKVLLDDGQTMSVSLTGFDHPERIALLENPRQYVGKWITFNAMAPVKVGGKPRGPAHYTKGNVRDSK